MTFWMPRLKTATLNEPKHREGAELKRFDIVIANPPFSQNYAADTMRFKERYQFWMPTKGKADFMFVQHRDQYAQIYRAHGGDYAAWRSFPWR